MKKYFSLLFPVFNLLGIVLVLFVLFHFNKGNRKIARKNHALETAENKDFPRPAVYSVKESHYKFASKRDQRFSNF